MKKIILFLIIIVLALCLYLVIPKKMNSVMYSWHIEDLETNELFDTLKKYNVKKLYQHFSTSYLNSSKDNYIKKIHKLNINIYHLCGEKEWAYDFDKIKKEIDKVLKFNEHNEKIDGIAFDIEKYLDGVENFKEEKYLETIKKTYDYMQKNNLYMILVIPYWYDSKYGNNYLKNIIINSDEISIMNYKINTTLKNIENEIKFAKKYSKKINTIYEIDYDNSNKFSNLTEIKKDYEKIYKNYKYNKLSIAYHHYNKINEYDKRTK